jgi:YbbR domain-containing protein
MKKFLKNLVFRNFGLKLFSFLLALVLWLALIPEEKIFSEKTVTVPLEIYNTPPQMELVEKPAPTVDVRVRAPNRLLNEINSATVRAILDLSTAELGQQEYALRNSMIILPQDAEVKDISPSQVDVVMEAIEEIMLEVEPVITGQPPEGYKFVRAIADPAIVAVRGAESRLKDSYKVKTAPVDISGFTQPEMVEVGLIPPHPDLRLTYPDAKVKIRIFIEPPEEENSEEKKIQ